MNDDTTGGRRISFAKGPKTLRPCDCHDQYTANKLDHQGYGMNDDSITVEPTMVVLKYQSTTIRIPQHLFKRFAEWYLEPQEIEDK